MFIKKHKLFFPTITNTSIIHKKPVQMTEQVSEKTQSLRSISNLFNKFLFKVSFAYSQFSVSSHQNLVVHRVSQDCSHKGANPRAPNLYSKPLSTMKSKASSLIVNSTSSIRNNFVLFDQSIFWLCQNSS
jgi:CRISPR/Cas system-associated protein endoribonuclease Cas2